MHVAVAGVHVQGDEHAPPEYLIMQHFDTLQHRAIGNADEDLLHQGLEFALPRDTRRIILQAVEHRLIGVQRIEQRLPARPHLGHRLQGQVAPLTDHRFGIQPILRSIAQMQRPAADVAAQEFFQCGAQGQLVADRQLDVEPVDAVAIVAHARQGNHHILVDLEGVGVAGDRRRTAAIEPELLARFRGDGDETLATACVGHLHHGRGGAHHCVFVGADDIADQHHLRPAVALGLGGVADRLHIALVEMLEAGQLHAGGQPRAARLEVVGDLDNARHGIAHLAEEFEADGARHRRHLVQDPDCRSDDAVAAFLLHAGQAGEKLVGDVLAQAGLAEGAARDGQHLFAHHGSAVAQVLDAKCDRLLLVDLAQIVVDPLHLQPRALRVHHPPRSQVVERRPPQHGLFATGIHGDVAADAGGIGRGRVAGEDAAGRFRPLDGTAGDDTGTGKQGGIRLRQSGQQRFNRRAHVDELFGIDDRRARRKRHGAPGIAGAAAARDDGQLELDQPAHQRGNLLLGIGRQHDEGILDPPVGGIRHVRHP